MDKQQLEQQVQRYRNYLEQDKNNLNLIVSLCDCYIRLNELEQAQQFMRQAQQLNPDINWSQQGLIDRNRGELLTAKIKLSLGLAENDTPGKRYHLSYCLYLNQEWHEALAILQPLRSEQKTDEIVLLQARILHRLYQIDEAIALLEKMAASPLKHAECLSLLSLLYYDQGEVEKADQLSLQALSIQANHYEAVLVQLLLKAGTEQPPVKDIETLISKHPNDCRLWFVLGSSHLSLQDFAAANEAFQQASRLWPDFYDNWISLGWCQLFQNTIQQAVESFQKALSISPEAAEGWGGMALVYALTQQTDKAQDQLTKAKQLDPDCFSAAVAEMMLSKDHPEKAADQFTQLFPAVSENIRQLLEARSQVARKHPKGGRLH